MASSEETLYFSHTLTLSPLSEPPNHPFPCRLAYRTHGSSENPTILLPSCYGGKLASTTPFLYSSAAAPSGSSPPFPPSKYHIIVVGLLGGSESSSPSNTPTPYDGPRFPKTTYQDNITLQKALCDHLGVKSLYAYIGFSMGGQQAYHMAALYPGFAERIVCLAGSARTSMHNWCFLEGPKAALVNSVDFEGGHYKTPAAKGTGAFGRVYSAWALSQEWFRQECWKKTGHETLEEYLKVEWEDGLGEWDANDLLCLLWTWQNGNITVYHDEDKGDLGKALQRIKSNCLVMPSATDTYFPPEDNEVEVKLLGEKGTFLRIESIWGHLAGGGGGTEDDTKFIMEEIGKWV